MKYICKSKHGDYLCVAIYLSLAEKSVVAPAKIEARYLSPHQNHPRGIFFSRLFSFGFLGFISRQCASIGGFFI